MKNPRGIQLTPELIEKHQLSTTKPASDSLFWKLWNANKDIAEKALNTKFVQGIKNGNLDPGKYGAFNVSDAYYCFHGAEDYGSAVERGTHPALKDFLSQKMKSYNDYNDGLVKSWRLKDGSGIVPTDVCKAYSDFERRVATTEDPIYCIIVMLPCEYLWYWLGDTLNPPTKGNLYASWITGNLYSDGAYGMGNFLELYQQKYPEGIDEAKAMAIYKQAITFEYQNFQTAL